MKKLYTKVFMLIILSFVFSLSGCSSDGKSESAVTTEGEQEVYDIRIPDIYSNTGVFIPYIAAAKGFYEAEGINPVFTGVVQPGQIVASVIAGDADVGYLHVNRTIAGIAGGAKIKAVVADSETSEEFPHMEFVVLDDGPLKEATDIIGKKVGLITLGGCNEYTPYEILIKNGIENPREQIEIVPIPPGTEETALRSGEVDVVGFHGHPIDAFNNGNLRILFDDYDVWGTVGGATPFYFLEDFIEKNPEAVRRFVAAHAKAGKWVNEHVDEAKQIQADWVGAPVEKITTMHYTNDGIIKEDSVQVWLDLLKGYGELKVDLTAQDIYTNEFNPNSPDYKFN